MTVDYAFCWLWYFLLNLYCPVDIVVLSLVQSRSDRVSAYWYFSLIQISPKSCLIPAFCIHPYTSILSKTCLSYDINDVISRGINDMLCFLFFCLFNFPCTWHIHSKILLHHGSISGFWLIVARRLYRDSCSLVFWLFFLFSSSSSFYFPCPPQILFSGQKANLGDSHAGLESQIGWAICRWTCRKMCW